MGGIGFLHPINIERIDAATFPIHYFDEIQGQPLTLLSAAILASDQSLNLTVAGTSAAGPFIQIETEVMQIIAVLNNGTQHLVTRAMPGTTGATHARPPVS